MFAFMQKNWHFRGIDQILMEKNIDAEIQILNKHVNDHPAGIVTGSHYSPLRFDINMSDVFR